MWSLHVIWSSLIQPFQFISAITRKPLVFFAPSEALTIQGMVSPRWFLQRKEQTGCNSKTPGWVRKDNYKHCMQQSGEERSLHFSESSDWWPGNSNKETYQERTDSSLFRSVLYEAAGYKQWEGIFYEQSALCTGSGTPHRAELRRAGLTLHGVTNFSEILHMPFKWIQLATTLTSRNPGQVDLGDDMPYGENSSGFSLTKFAREVCNQLVLEKICDQKNNCGEMYQNTSHSSLVLPAELEVLNTCIHTNSRVQPRDPLAQTAFLDKPLFL